MPVDVIADISTAEAVTKALTRVPRRRSVVETLAPNSRRKMTANLLRRGPSASEGAGGYLPAFAEGEPDEKRRQAVQTQSDTPAVRSSLPRYPPCRGTANLPENKYRDSMNGSESNNSVKGTNAQLETAAGQPSQVGTTGDPVREVTAAHIQDPTPKRDSPSKRRVSRRSKIVAVSSEDRVSQ